MEQKKVNSFKIYSVFDPAPYEPEDQSSHFVHQTHLDYDEHGKVVVIDDGDMDFYQLIQEDKDSATLVSQIKTMAMNGQTQALATNYGDVSELPDNINDYRQSIAERHKAANAEIKKAGLDGDVNDYIKLKPDELEQLIKSNIEKLYKKEEPEAPKEEVK